MTRFPGGLVSKAHGLRSSLNSRLESNKEEEKGVGLGGCGTHFRPAVLVPAVPGFVRRTVNFDEPMDGQFLLNDARFICVERWTVNLYQPIDGYFVSTDGRSICRRRKMVNLFPKVNACVPGFGRGNGFRLCSCVRLNLVSSLLLLQGPPVQVDRRSTLPRKV